MNMKRKPLKKQIKLYKGNQVFFDMHRFMQNSIYNYHNSFSKSKSTL